jgi:hypothetical protein
VDSKMTKEKMNALKTTIPGAHLVLTVLMVLTILSQKMALWWLDNLINFQQLRQASSI